MTIKPRGNIYSINEGYASLWDKAVIFTYFLSYKNYNLNCFKFYI